MSDDVKKAFDAYKKSQGLKSSNDSPSPEIKKYIFKNFNFTKDKKTDVDLSIEKEKKHEFENYPAVEKKEENANQKDISSKKHQNIKPFMPQHISKQIDVNLKSFENKDKKDSYFIKEIEKELISGESNPKTANNILNKNFGNLKTHDFIKLEKYESGDANNKEIVVTEKEKNKYSKIAKILLLLGKDEAASVIKHFKPEEIEKIAASLMKVKNIDKDEASSLLKEINKKIQLHETFSGGVETVRQMLYTAFGKDKGEKFLSKALPETKETPFEFLKDVEPHRIKLALKDEPVVMIAVIMNYLEPEKSAALLKEYTKDEQTSILLRMASGGKMQKEIFEKMEYVIKEKVRAVGTNVEYKIDGRSRLANILKFMDIKNEEDIISNINEYDPELSKEITQQVYTIDMIFDISSKDMQKILNDFSDKEIAIILKGKEDRIKEKIFSSLSSGRKELVNKESEYLGIMRKSEVNLAAREFIDYLKQADKEGVITINRAGTSIV
jgi:flagellar motor switch protein FliG